MVRLLASDLKHCEASASALALACCSKRLGDIVLDSLWEQVDGLVRLMRCLPPETWELREVEGTSYCEFVRTTWVHSDFLSSLNLNRQAFLRCPSTEEWFRFSSYARRIRTFYASSGFTESPGVPPAVYHMLSMQTPTLGHHLFPNLRSIYWGLYPWNLLHFLQLFLNPGLVDVTIEFPDNDLHIYRPAAISLIPTKNLTHLRLLYMEDDDPLSMNALHNLLDKASKTLRSVRLDGEPSMAVIEKLLQLPNLRCLHVHLPGSLIFPSAVVFPTLRELKVTFLGSSPAYLQTLGTSLLDAPMERTLTSFECACDKIPLTEAGLRPLLSFRRLTKLVISSSCTEEQCNSQLNDSIISELAAALPQLTRLELGNIPCKAPTSDVTVASLVALSTHCVDLEVLQLHFNTNDITPYGTHTNSQTHKFTCKLRVLSVGSQPLPSNYDNDALRVAFALLHLFPHLRIVSHRGWTGSQVGQVVHLFREAPKTVLLLATN